MKAIYITRDEILARNYKANDKKTTDHSKHVITTKSFLPSLPSCQQTISLSPRSIIFKISAPTLLPQLLCPSTPCQNQCHHHHNLQYTLSLGLPPPGHQVQCACTISRLYQRPTISPLPTIADKIINLQPTPKPSNRYHLFSQINNNYHRMQKRKNSYINRMHLRIPINHNNIFHLLRSCDI